MRTHRKLIRAGRLVLASGTIAVVIAGAQQSAHAGIFVNHCEPVLPR